MAFFTNWNDNSIVSGTSNDDTVVNYSGNVTIKAGKGNDSIRNYYEGHNSLIDGGAGNDYISNKGDKVSILAGAGNDKINNQGDFVLVDAKTGNDSIFSWGNNVTINSGAGNDSIYNNCRREDDGNIYYFDDGGYGDSKGSNVLFNYKSGDGNDIIYGFKADSTLSIGGGAYSTKKSGDNVIVTVGKGKITLVGAASLSSVNIKGTKLLTVTDKTKSPVTVDAITKIIDASSRTKAVKITGNGLANTIIGGSKNDSLYGRAGNDSIVGNAGNDKLYGSNGNDTLVGGKGNDTLWGDAGNDKLYGGSGKDVFIYKPGEGTDTIFDYSSGDMLKILKSNGKDGGTFTSSTFKNNNLTLAIEGGGKVIFDGVSKGDKFNINGKTYTLGNSKLK